jgi:hypothetical protein
MFSLVLGPKMRCVIEDGGIMLAAEYNAWLGVSTLSLASYSLVYAVKSL